MWLSLSSLFSSLGNACPRRPHLRPASSSAANGRQAVASSLCQPLVSRQKVSSERRSRKDPSRLVFLPLLVLLLCTLAVVESCPHLLSPPPHFCSPCSLVLISLALREPAHTVCFNWLTCLVVYPVCEYARIFGVCCFCLGLHLTYMGCWRWNLGLCHARQATSLPALMLLQPTVQAPIWSSADWFPILPLGRCGL